jgi:hypothetical protein
MVHCHIVVLTRAHSSLDLHLTTFTTESTLSCPASFANTASSSYDNRWYPYHDEMVELPGAGCSLPTRSMYLGCPGKKNAYQLPTVRIPCHKCHINIVVEFERSNAFYFQMGTFVHLSDVDKNNDNQLWRVIHEIFKYPRSHKLCDTLSSQKR